VEFALQFNVTEGGVALEDAVPVPFSATVAVEFEALLTTDKLPLTVPAVVGVNFTENEALLPAATVSGRVCPLTVKPAAGFTAVIVTDAVPAVTVSVCEALLPTDTEPKLSEPGLTVSVPAAVPATVMLRDDLYAVPPLSHASMTTLCAPLARVKDVFSELASTRYSLTLSTYISIDVIVLPEFAVAEATN
jgi:hypothetical protein